VRVSTKLFCAAASAALLAPAVLQAQAGPVQRVIALGDSYIDDGNVFELTGTARPPIYPLGRFSNGTNLVDTIARELSVPVLNYGIGGAVARAQNTNLPSVQAFDLQVNSFLAGGGPAAFPRSEGRFEPTDLLVVNIGANDARAYERSLGLTPTAAQIATLAGRRSGAGAARRGRCDPQSRPARCRRRAADDGAGRRCRAACPSARAPDRGGRLGLFQRL
jgi:hypothetical protein